MNPGVITQQNLTDTKKNIADTSDVHIVDVFGTVMYKLYYISYNILAQF